MYKLVIPAQELYNEETNEFSEIKETVLQLEHSLVSLSRWESITHKPFLVEKERTDDDLRLYIQCMTITQNVDPKVYESITRKEINEVLKYIDDPMTATWFRDDKTRGTGNRTGETITSEYLYYQMIELGIPFECQKWHLNRLMTLIKVICVKSKGGNKMSQKDMMKNYSALKAARRKPKM